MHKNLNHYDFFYYNKFFRDANISYTSSKYHGYLVRCVKDSIELD